MAEHKHTPAPWRWEMNAHQSINGARVVGASGRIVCRVPSIADGPLNEKTANLHLLASAPALLSALEYILADVEPSVFALSEIAREKAHAALAKARGEAND